MALMLLNPNSSRARQARLGKRIGRVGYVSLIAIGTLGLVGGLAVILIHKQSGYWLLALAGICYLPSIWWKRQLSIVPPQDDSLQGRLSVETLARFAPNMPEQPQAVWASLSGHWQAAFITHHLLLPDNAIAEQLGTTTAELKSAFQIATKIADDNDSKSIELGFVVAGLLLASPNINQLLTRAKAQSSDIEAIANWLGRSLNEAKIGKQSYGGIGRDWAFGFTPLLDRFGLNVSLAIIHNGAHFGWLTNSKGVSALEAALQNQTNTIALIGPSGIGKTSHVYALAQKLIEGRHGSSLAYHQIRALNATDIVSRARVAGDLEQIMISLANEASHAGHIILFFDDAQLFFSGKPGAFDATQILLSIVQAKSVPMIFAMSPNDYQHLKSSSPSFASLLSLVILEEPGEANTMRILEDTASGLEYRNHILIAYESLHEAYRLSGRYEQDEAYPGKAIKLLEQSIAHADNSIVSAISVQRAIEQTYGVKATATTQIEADALLHLEDSIHQRMINQTHAVSVVASALRRSRAGVTNPRRPIGSFLFLGPTGVGKTELAKALASTYFSSESNLIRLDMSEYQQPDDVQRLLSAEKDDSGNLLLSVRKQPFSVVLLDEIEKAHPNVLNLLLQLLDEGKLTDASGRAASFKDCIVIVTSNAGAETIRAKITAGESLESFAPQLTNELISNGQFKPELLNRFDEIVLFRPLTPDELAQIVQLMVTETNLTLANQNISIELTPAAIQKIVERGNDPRLGARPMRRVLQRTVEDTVAQRILRGEIEPGDHVTLDTPDLSS